MNVKVILNKDHAPLGEEGDVREVARGYARNFLFPRKIAYPYQAGIVSLFEARRGEIEQRKAEKRRNALGLKEQLETLNLVITVPAGANGKLYGAVTTQTIMDELAKQGFPVERKRIEMAGNNIKNVGKYQVTVKLYENSSATVNVGVQAQAIKAEPKVAPLRPNRRRREPNAENPVERVAEPEQTIPQPE
ncbi:50S ribosomal protein L9 [Spirochaetia bacterium]|nr:50S ribosomal protein L9 [Spirochaetia bacterium]GHU36266.1 50S ribosomal protein L9 [Spirochaetia bacterium]